MNAIVTPSDVDPEGLEHPESHEEDEETRAAAPPIVIATDPDAPPSTVTGDVPLPSEDKEKQAPATNVPATPPTKEELEIDRLKRLDAMLDKWVPNKAIWPQLRALETPQDVFTPDEMPFDERAFMSWRSFNSILLPYYGCMATVLSSTWLAFTTLVNRTSEDDDEQYPLASAVATLLPLILALLVLTALHEYPCRSYLYHRLWERKVVVEFKSRTLTHRVTFVKMLLLACCVLFYLGFGAAEFGMSWSYFQTIIQSFGTIAWVIYSSLDVNKSLVPINSAIRHCLDAQKTAQKAMADDDKKQDAVVTPTDGSAVPTQENVTDPDATRVVASVSVDFLASTVAKVRVVQEADIKRDIFGLQRCQASLANLLKSAKLENDVASIRRIEEQHAWLRIWATWIGRLGHTIPTLTVDAGWFTQLIGNELYMFAFLGDKDLFDDALWHSTGSFATRANQSNFRNEYLKKSFTVAGLLVVVIELFGFYLSLSRQAAEDEVL